MSCKSIIYTDYVRFQLANPSCQCPAFKKIESGTIIPFDFNCKFCDWFWGFIFWCKPGWKCMNPKSYVARNSLALFVDTWVMIHVFWHGFKPEMFFLALLARCTLKRALEAIMKTWHSWKKGECIVLIGLALCNWLRCHALFNSTLIS